MKSEKGKVIVFYVVLDLKVVVESIQLYVDGYKLKWWEWDTAQIVCSQIELCSMMIAVGEFVLVLYGDTVCCLQHCAKLAPDWADPNSIG